MGKRAKRQFNARLKDETIFMIEELAKKWECTQAEVIEQVVTEAAIRARRYGGSSISGEAVSLLAKADEEFRETRQIIPIDEV